MRWEPFGYLVLQEGVSEALDEMILLRKHRSYQRKNNRDSPKMFDIMSEFLWLQLEILTVESYFDCLNFCDGLFQYNMKICSTKPKCRNPCTSYSGIFPRLSFGLYQNILNVRYLLSFYKICRWRILLYESPMPS